MTHEGVGIHTKKIRDQQKGSGHGNFNCQMQAMVMEMSVIRGVNVVEDWGLSFNQLL
jgi:hypothetical protein